MTSASEPRVAQLTEVTVSAHAWISGEELASAAGISSATLFRIVRLGLVEPASSTTTEFPASLVPRLRRMLRLRRDLGVDLAVATVMAELMEKVEQLESELERVRAER